MPYICLSQWPRGLRRRSTAAHLLGLWVRIPPQAWMSVSVECCVLSGRGLCDGLITRPEKSYRLWCVVVCDLETSRIRRPWPALGHSATGGGNVVYIYINFEKYFISAFLSTVQENYKIAKIISHCIYMIGCRVCVCVCVCLCVCIYIYIYIYIYTGWLKKMDSISYVYITWTIYGMWMIYIIFGKGSLHFQIPPLELSPSAQPCSSISWEQHGCNAAQYFLRSWVH